MKLASLRDGTRDGRLVVVARDLERCTSAANVAPTLQAALDDWAKAGPRLAELSAALEQGVAPFEAFDQAAALSPLPRAYQWADGSAYVNHVALVRQARGVEVPASFYEDPLMYQGGSDIFLAPRDPIQMADEAWGIDCEAEIAVIVDDVPAGIAPKEARQHVQLVMLVNDVSLRGLTAGELAKGFGFFQSKPPTAFSPVAVSPDELGDAWQDGTLSLPLLTAINGTAFGCPNAGHDMTFDFGTLIAHAARTRPLGAGTIIGSGTVSNKGADGGPGRPISEGGVGYSCIAEIRTVETIRQGEPSTPFLRYGDTVRIEMNDGDGRSIFGVIEQSVTQ